MALGGLFPSFIRKGRTLRPITLRIQHSESDSWVYPIYTPTTFKNANDSFLESRTSGSAF
ncbi:DUF6392 family protein [Klebsiella oxytoca]|uniref:DUF6392 family protein n=1 Tax=Klebsiella oxytoca TaxID=571 RepID=UPI001C8D2254